MENRIKRTGMSFLDEIKTSSFFKNTSQIVTGNMIAQILSIIFMPITSRLYGPVFFGEFGVFTATINLVNGLVCLGLVSAIISPEDDQEASAIYKVSLISVSTFAIVMLTLAMFFAPVFHVINVSANYYWICILMGIFLVVNNWASMTYIWGNRQKNYKLLMYNPIIASVVNFVVAYSFGIIGMKSYGLVAGAILSQVAILIHLLIRLRPMNFKHSFDELKNILTKYKDFPKYQMPSSFLRGFGAQFPILIMSFYFGTSFVGQYNMGQRLLYLPITLVGGAMGHVHFKQATDLSNSGQDVGEFTYKVVKSILIFAFIPLLLFAVFGELIFKVLLGAQWEMAGTIVQIRSFEFLFTSMFFSVSYIMVVLKRQKMMLVYTIFTLFFNNLTVFIGGRVANDIVTVFILSIGSAILNLLFLLYAFSQTALGVKRYLKLVLFASVLFLIIAITGNYILRGLLK